MLISGNSLGSDGKGRLVRSNFGASSAGDGPAFKSGYPTGEKWYDASKAGERRPVQTGRCYTFDGTDDEVIGATAITALSATTADSVSFWFKKASAPGAFQQVFNNYATSTDIFSCIVQTDGTIRFQHVTSSAKGSIGSTTDVCDGEWHHIFTTFDGVNTGKIWIDGVSESNTGGGATGTNVGWTLGARTDSAFHLGAEIFDFRVYDSELTDENMLYVYSFGEYGTAPGVPAFWLKCDEQAGTTAYDCSGNGNHGVITGATLSTFHGTQTKYSFQNQVGYSGALYFDGANDHVLRRDVETGVTDGEFTWSAWVDFDSFAGSSQYDAVMAFNTAIMGLYVLSADVSGTNPKFMFWDGAANTFNTILAPRTSYHVCVTRDASNVVRCYVDGAEEASTHTVTRDITSPADFRIAADNQGTTYSNVKMRDVRLYSSQLSASEVSFLYDSTTGTDPGTASLVLQWALNESEGAIAYDASSNANHGVLVNGALASFYPRDESSTANDVTGLALDYSGKAPQDVALIDSHCGTFDGTDDYVTIPDDAAFDGTTALSVAFWAKNDNAAISPSEYVVTKWGTGAAHREWHVRINTAEKVEIGLSSDGTAESNVTTDAAIDVDAWNHIAFTYDGATTTVKFYVNGAEVASSITFGSIPSAIHNSTAAIEIGARDGGSGNWQGQICDVRMYGDVLTANEVLYLYDNERGTNPGTSNLSGHWPLAEGGGATAYDASGNGNSGTITNATLATFWGAEQDNFHLNLNEGFDGAYFCDGSGDYIEYPDSSTLDVGASDSFSLFARCIPDSNMTSTGAVFSKAVSTSGAGDPGWRLYFTGASRTAVFLIADGTTRAYVAIPNNDANKVVSVGLTFDRGTNTWAAYRNGVLYGTGVSDGPLSAIGDLTNSEPCRVGSNFSGSVLEAKFYKARELTSDEHLALHEGTFVEATGLNLDVDCAAMQLSKVPDLTGNQADGVVTGGCLPIKLPAGLGVRPEISQGAGNWHNGCETDINWNPNSSPELTNLYKGYLDLTGGSHYVSVADSASTTLINKITFDAFFPVEVNASTSSQHILATYDAAAVSFGLALGSVTGSLTNEVITLIMPSSARSGVTDIEIAPGWHSFEIAWTGSAYAISIDGVAQTVTNDLTPSRLDARRITIGAYLDGSGSFFNGRIRNLKIWDSSDALVRDYPFAWGADDISGSNRSGVVTGATFPKHTLDTDYSFEESLGEQWNHFKKVHTDDKAYGVFDGSSSKVINTNVRIASSAGTIIVDVRTTNTAQSNTMIFGALGSSSNRFYLKWKNATEIEIARGDPATFISAQANPASGTWYRIAMTWESSTAYSYSNGVPTTSAAFTDPGTDDAYVSIGALSGTSNYFDGNIRNFKYYSTRLSDDEIAAEFRGETVQAGSLVAHYLLEKDAKDITNRAFDATPTDVTFDGYTQESNYLIYDRGVFSSDAARLERFLKTSRTR